MKLLRNLFIFSVCMVFCMVCIGQAQAGIGVEIDNANIGSDRDMSIFTGGRNNVDYYAHGVPDGRGVNFIPPCAPLINPPTVSGGGPATPMELYESQNFKGWDVIYTGSPSIQKNWPEGVVNIPEAPVAAGRCFPVPFPSTLTPAGNGGWYRWRIVLQEKPHSDFVLKVRGCILENEGLTVYKPSTPEIIEAATTPRDSAAGETGAFHLNNNLIQFIPSANPTIKVWAEPGPYSTFSTPFNMAGVVMPGGLSRDDADDCTVLDGSADTRFALVGNFDATILLQLPEDGINECNQETSVLHQGDMIEIIIKIPDNNVVDVRLGRQSVWLQYNAIVGTSITSRLPNLPWSVGPQDPLSLDDYIL
ncbi:MAG: hypothetical protein ACMUJM_21480 [bacterium]